MTNFKHQRPSYEADFEHLATVASYLHPSTTYVRLPMGRSPSQGFSKRCAAEAIANVAETCRAKHGTTRFPAIAPEAIYLLAKTLDNYSDHKGGTDLTAAAEAYCRLADTSIAWQILPNDKEIIANHLLVERTGVALGLRWSPSDNVPNQDMLLGGTGLEPNGHAVAVCGWTLKHAWNRGPWGRLLSLFGIKSKSQITAEVLHIENSASADNSRRYYLPAWRLATDAVQAVAFWSPTPRF